MGKKSQEVKKFVENAIHQWIKDNEATIQERVSGIKIHDFIDYEDIQKWFDKFLKHVLLMNGKYTLDEKDVQSIDVKLTTNFAKFINTIDTLVDNISHYASQCPDFTLLDNEEKIKLIHSLAVLYIDTVLSLSPRKYLYNAVSKQCITYLFAKIVQKIKNKKKGEDKIKQKINEILAYFWEIDSDIFYKSIEKYTVEPIFNKEYYKSLFTLYLHYSLHSDKKMNIQDIAFEWQKHTSLLKNNFLWYLNTFEHRILVLFLQTKEYLIVHCSDTNQIDELSITIVASHLKYILQYCPGQLLTAEIENELKGSFVGGFRIVHES